MEEKENVESISKGVEILKRDIKSIDKQVVMLGLMVLGVCIFFFFLGYYYGVNNATTECNKVILENQVISKIISPITFG